MGIQSEQELDGRARRLRKHFSPDSVWPRLSVAAGKTNWKAGPTTRASVQSQRLLQKPRKRKLSRYFMLKKGNEGCCAPSVPTPPRPEQQLSIAPTGGARYCTRSMRSRRRRGRNANIPATYVDYISLAPPARVTWTGRTSCLAPESRGRRQTEGSLLP